MVRAGRARRRVDRRPGGPAGGGSWRASRKLRLWGAVAGYAAVVEGGSRRMAGTMLRIAATVSSPPTRGRSGTRAARVAPRRGPEPLVRQVGLCGR